MPDSQQRWPGYGQDREDERARRERQIEDFIRAQNLEGRMRAADPVQRDRTDPSTGRTWGDAVGRGMYDHSRVKNYQEQSERNRQDRERFRWRQAREQGREGRN